MKRTMRIDLEGLSSVELGMDGGTVLLDMGLVREALLRLAPAPGGQVEEARRLCELCCWDPTSIADGTARASHATFDEADAAIREAVVGAVAAMLPGVGA